MNLNDWIKANKQKDRLGYTTLPYIMCQDGRTHLAVQVGKAKSAIYDPIRSVYTHVEVDVFDGQVPKDWERWLLCGQTYDFVPIEEVEKFIAKHGGILLTPVPQVSDYLR